MKALVAVKFAPFSKNDKRIALMNETESLVERLCIPVNITWFLDGKKHARRSAMTQLVIVCKCILAQQSSNKTALRKDSLNHRKMQKEAGDNQTDAFSDFLRQLMHHEH